MRHHSYALAILALSTGSLAFPDGTGGHHHGAHHAEHGAHHADHGAAAAPSTGYEAADTGYAVPDAGYAVPDAGYASPEVDYSYSSGYEVQEPYGAAQESGPDMSFILVPLLIVAALALLFPSVRVVDVNGQGGRRKREADDSAAANVIERVQDMYMALMESEECMERVACEIGGLAEDAGFSKKMTKMVEKFAPKKYSKMMKNFNHGKDCKKNNKCGLF